MLLKPKLATAFIAGIAACTLVSCGEQEPSKSPEKTDTTEIAPDLPPAPPAPAPSALLASTSVFERKFSDTPVHWRLWGSDAFALAKKHQRPVFAFIGYSVCPWCARMKEEVFKDPKIAAFINENFVPVVVDAELHTEVNRILMAYVQASNGISGWPLNAFLTPDGAPLSASSYMTVNGNPGKPGFTSVAEHISTQWKQYPDHYADQAMRDIKPLLDRFGNQSVESLTRPSAEMLSSAVASLAADFDPLSGGFDSQPKFLFPPRLEFLLERAASSSTDDYGKKRALDMVYTTLEKAALSATRDILAGGFFRYSTDPYWNGPNFEKHLADQALNAAVYSAAFSTSKNVLHREVVYEIFHFLENTFASESGTFYTSQATGFVPATGDDATTGSPIGHYFTWSPEEIQNALGEERASAFGKAFSIKNRGNLSSSSSLHSPLSGRNVLIPRSRETIQEFAPEIKKLTAARDARPTPLIDETIALAPNAYAAIAFARAGRIFEDPALTARAEKILRTLRKTHCAGTPLPALRNILGDTEGPPANANDYAALTAAYLEMHSTTGDAKWLADATTTQEEQTKKFYDTHARGFFETPANDTLFMRIKPVLDASVPSLNSLSTLNLITLAEKNGDPKFRKQAWETLYGLSPFYRTSVGRSTTLMQALGVLLDSGNPGE